MPGASFTTQIRERWERKRCKLLPRPTKHNYSLTWSCLDAAASNNYQWSFLWYTCSQLHQNYFHSDITWKKENQLRSTFFTSYQVSANHKKCLSRFGIGRSPHDHNGETWDDRCGCEISVRLEPSRRFFSNVHKMSFCGRQEQKVDFWWNRKFACIAAALQQQLQKDPWHQH